MIFPSMFQPKVTIIEENKNLGTMKVEELMGSHCTHGMNLKHRNEENPLLWKPFKKRFRRKMHGIGLEGKDDQLALMTKNFNKFWKRFEMVQNLLLNSQKVTPSQILLTK